MENTLYFIIGGAIVLATLIVLEPSLDRNKETGKWIFWYTWNYERKFIQL